MDRVYAHFPKEFYKCTTPSAYQEWRAINVTVKPVDGQVFCHDCPQEFNTQEFLAGRCPFPCVEDAIAAHRIKPRRTSTPVKVGEAKWMKSRGLTLEKLKEARNMLRKKSPFNSVAESLGINQRVLRRLINTEIWSKAA